VPVPVPDRELPAPSFTHTFTSTEEWLEHQLLRENQVCVGWGYLCVCVCMPLLLLLIPLAFAATDGGHREDEAAAGWLID